MMSRLGIMSVMLASFAVSAGAVEVAGDWQVTISTSDRTVAGVASLKQAGERVTGWVGPSEDDPIPVDGIVKGNKLTLQTHPQEGRTVAFSQCELTVGGDKMTGAIDTDQGRIEFVKKKR